MSDYNRYDHMTPQEIAYELDVVAAEQRDEEERFAQQKLLPTLAKIIEGRQAVTAEQIERALNSARVVLSPLQRNDFMQSLAMQVQQGI